MKDMINLMGAIPRTFVAHRFTYWCRFKFGSLRDLLTLVFRLGYSHKSPLQNLMYMQLVLFGKRNIQCEINILLGPDAGATEN